MAQEVTYCSECGGNLVPGAKFCASCGKARNISQTAPNASPVGHQQKDEGQESKKSGGMPPEVLGRLVIGGGLGIFGILRLNSTAMQIASAMGHTDMLGWGLTIAGAGLVVWGLSSMNNR